MKYFDEKNQLIEICLLYTSYKDALDEMISRYPDDQMFQDLLTAYEQDNN